MFGQLRNMSFIQDKCTVNICSLPIKTITACVQHWQVAFNQSHRQFNHIVFNQNFLKMAATAQPLLSWKSQCDIIMNATWCCLICIEKFNATFCPPYLWKSLSLPVLWCVSQWHNNVLVDEDEEGQQEADAHCTDDVHGRQSFKRSHTEDGPVVNFEDGNCSGKEEKGKQWDFWKYSTCMTWNNVIKAFNWTFNCKRKTYFYRIWCLNYIYQHFKYSANSILTQVFLKVFWWLMFS